jgi:8-oxo-dGTP pyrophosphatase MutT (NUDIX family)
MIARPDGRILLALRAPWLPDPLVWSVPAGRLEPGEEPLDAALREGQEELGRVPTARVLAAYKDVRAQFTTFLAEISENDARSWRPKLNPENVDWGWFHLEELPTPLHPGVGNALREFIG